MLKNWFKMSTMLISIPFKAAAQDWKGLGHDIGSLIKDFVEVPEQQTAAEAAASRNGDDVPSAASDEVPQAAEEEVP